MEGVLSKGVLSGNGLCVEGVMYGGGFVRGGFVRRGFCPRTLKLRWGTILNIIFFIIESFQVFVIVLTRI